METEAPLNLAIASGSALITRLLLRSGADPQSLDAKGVSGKLVAAVCAQLSPLGLPVLAEMVRLGVDFSISAGPHQLEPLSVLAQNPGTWSFYLSLLPAWECERLSVWQSQLGRESPLQTQTN